jgi:predicted ATPase/class 3 adenylate cyclase
LSISSAFEVIPASQPESQQAETKTYSSKSDAQDEKNRAGQPTPDLPGTRFDRFVPKELMAKLEAARSSGTMVGERRVVTILFCDVAGSTSAAEHLDPEEWTEIINGAFEHMIKPVYNYEGTVARLTGDGILAFFGAPITHEDDPQRAILAGLDIVSTIETYSEKIKRDWDIDFNVRVGINTGRVVVGAVGSDLRMEYTAMGDAINLAARMEQTATPGTVRVANETYRLISPLFDFEELGGIQVKGKSEPVLAYRVLGRKKSEGRLRGIEGLEIEMIGRDRELTDLASTMAHVQRGIGGIVCLIGEAGLGKSRLLRELRKNEPLLQNSTLSSSLDEPTAIDGEAIDSGVSSLQWIETSSLSFETAQPYALFRRLIRRINGINHSDPPEIVRKKLTSLAEQVTEDEGGHAIAVLEALFGLRGDDNQLPLEGEAFKRALFELMPALWRHHFEGQTVVIVCDDLHWSDPASIALLHDLLPLTEEMAIVFIFVFRPERDVPGWQIKTTADEKYRHLYTEIYLHPLSGSQSNDMIDALLGDPELPDELRSRVLERAEGNPFFIEEVIRTLIDGGALIPGERINGHHSWRAATDSSDIVIPDNLQALLTARIDNLSEEARQTLQVASVIGRNFYKRVLKLINDASDEFEQHIQTLLREEMIRESSRVPEIEYRFSNPLTQEAAYRTILLKRRREFHLRVGEVMESLFADHLEEQAPQLAYHFREAHQYKRSMYHFKQAGDIAFRLFANEEAVTHYGDALEMARKSKETISSEDLLHLYMRRGRALEHLVASAAAMENYQAMLAHGQEKGITKICLEAMMAMATILVTQTSIQDVDRARELSEESLELAKSLEDRAAESKIYWNLLNTIAFADGDMDKALAYGENSLAIARELELKEQIAFTLNSMIMIYWKNNLLTEGMGLLEEVSVLWRELDNQPMLADSFSMSSFIQLITGDYKAATETLEELERISIAINNTWNLSAGGLFLGLCYIECGEIDKGVNSLMATIDVSAQAGLFGNELLAKAILAGAYSLLGEDELAIGLADETIERIEEVRIHDRALMFGLAAAAIVRSGANSQAKEILETLSGYDTDSGNNWYIAYIVGAKAEYALADNRLEDALDIIEDHVSKLRKSGVFAPLPYLLYIKAQAELELGDPSASLHSLETALKESEQTGERLWRWQILGDLGDLASREGIAQPEDMEEWRAKEIETIEFISSHLSDPGLLDSFSAKPRLASLLEAQIQE